MTEISIHILVVDDERDMQVLVEHHFSHWLTNGNVKVSFRDNADDALAFLRSDEGKDVLLIMSDYNMPDTNGAHFLSTVKELFPHIDLFMISAYSTIEFFEKAGKIGIDGYFTKPIDFDALKRSIKDLHEELDVA